MQHLHIWHLMTAQLATAAVIGGWRICREHYWHATIAIDVSFAALVLIITIGVTAIRIYERLWNDETVFRWHGATLLNIWGGAVLCVASFTLLSLALCVVDYWLMAMMMWCFPIPVSQV